MRTRREIKSIARFSPVWARGSVAHPKDEITPRKSRRPFNTIGLAIVEAWPLSSHGRSGRIRRAAWPGRWHPTLKLTAIIPH